jgi:hypothetical protein
MTDFDKLLRAGLVWRDARRAVFGQLGHYKKMDQYTEACDALEKVMNELSPVESKITKPVLLEEALERSISEQLEMAKKRKARNRAYRPQHATYTDDPCPICSGGVCKAPVFFGVRPKDERRRHG